MIPYGTIMTRVDCGLAPRQRLSGERGIFHLLPVNSELLCTYCPNCKKCRFKPAHIYLASVGIEVFHEEKKIVGRNMTSKSCQITRKRSPFSKGPL